MGDSFGVIKKVEEIGIQVEQKIIIILYHMGNFCKKLYTLTKPPDISFIY